ncbi:lytic transglycosylase domain-containing protein [Virgibacillus sp. Bac332]|uniref:lytic transglycosylase domain-containing protein n=1 Tax=Virgibacillus sp. Bac332 TaxID=2419842 RepID=UPI000EF46C5F|nr:lytic transglycosylase domain-containing protein [Virgibacillus sp. Bac332]
MEIRELQQMMQYQAMSILTSNSNAISNHSPMIDLAFKQMLQNQLDQVSQLQAGTDLRQKSNTNKNTATSAVTTNTSLIPTNTSIDHLIEKAAGTYNLDKKLIYSVIKNESNFNPSARSSAGAQGLMQLMPTTAKGLGVTNPFDAEQNINGGAKYLSQMLGRYNGDVELALAAYNAGPGNVDKYQGIPPFTETRNYVNKVMGTYLA